MAELFEKAIKFFTDKGVSREVAIAYLAVGAALVVLAVVAIVLRIIVMVKYHDGNTRQTESGKSCVEVARQALDQAGLKEVKIAKAGWLRAFFFGNSYSLSKKTIFLRRGIMNKSSITAVGVAMQKVGIAKLINSGNKTAIVRNRSQVFSLFGPILLIPIILLGAILDVVIFRVFGTFSIVAIVISALIMVCGLLETFLNLPVEKKANEMAMQMIKDGNLLTPEEQIIIQKVFDAFIIAYICEFLIAVLRVVQIILEVVMNVQISNASRE